MLRAGVFCALIAGLHGEAHAQDVRPIVSVAVVDAPIDSVWAAWVKSEELRTWLAPHADMDLRVGGVMRTNYSVQGTLGDARTIENAVLAYEPQHMLSIKVSKVPEGFPFPNAIREMWTVIYLDPIAGHRTVVRVVGLGFTAGDESQRMRAFFDRGNAMTLQQLQRRFQKTPDK